MPKKVLVALPPGLLEQIDYVAQAEHRTRSDLIRDALRRYIEQFRRTQPNAAPKGGAKGEVRSVALLGEE
jgi:metal-responsive CopG/Arc/MetJ family transcriptional regulator